MSNALLITNGTILTMDPAQPEVEAVGVIGETIVAAGTRQAVEQMDQIGSLRATLDAVQSLLEEQKALGEQSREQSRKTLGKTPEQTMLSRLAAMARRTRERKVVVTSKDTFALVEWSIPEDAEALAQTGVVEPHPEETLPPMRPEERHPEPRNENARSSGRGSDRKRRRDEDDDIDVPPFMRH